MESDCPRKDALASTVFKLPPAEWQFRGAVRCCSYCGSIHPEEFMAYAETGGLLTPTDKSYKVYVHDYRKFYFQHLSDDQKRRFVELYNEGKIKLAHPGYFYVWPYFMRPFNSQEVKS